MKRPILYSILALVLACCVGLSCLTVGGAAYLFTQEQLGVQASATPTLVAVPIPTAIDDENLPHDTARQMDGIQQQVIQIRGLVPTNSLIRAMLSPEQLRENVINDFFKDYSEEEARDDVHELAALGLLEPGYDLYELYIELFSEQVAGYYDSETKEMFVVQGEGFQGTERMTYAHEFVHALQDQAYDLREGLRLKDEYCEKDAEACAAVQALIEGDASLTEQLWVFNHATAQDRKEIQQFAMNYKSPVYDSAPAYLKADFLFPYRAGQEFVETLHDQGGFAAVDAAFRNPPVSTEQILHPEKYPAEIPLRVDIPDLLPVLGDGWREYDRNMLGEWYTFLVLTNGVSEDARLSEQLGREAAAGWGGDLLVFCLNDQTQQSALVVRSVWDSQADADQFWQALGDYGQARWGSGMRGQDNSMEWLDVPEGFAGFYRRGLETLWLITPDQQTASAIRDALEAAPVTTRP